MKKLLLASSALVAFAGAASAEITMTGSAEMGVSGGDGLETLFHQSVDIRFTMSGESDSGLSFGAIVDLEDALDRAAAGADTTDDRGVNPDYTVFIKGSFGTLTMGDTDGALDWALTDAGNVANPGSIADNETTHAGYLGSYLDGRDGGQVLRYDYAFGDLAFAVSAEKDPSGAFDPMFAIGVKYALDLGGTALDLAAGYQTSDYIVTNETAVGVSVTAKLGGGFSAGVEYTQFSDWTGNVGHDVDHVGVGVGYASGPIALHVNYGEYDGNAAAAGSFGPDRSGFGLTAAYDLGGGLKVLGGYGSSDITGAPGTDNWSLGLKMAF